MLHYNREYAKTVRPRYFSAYSQGYPCVITSDRYQARLLQKNFKHTIRKEGRLYIVTLQLRKIYPHVTY